MLKLLIVDDEKRTREGLRKCIQWNSIGIGEIQEADDGDTAIDAALTFKPDIILSDIMMPRMTGINFATFIHKALPNSKIIFISGYSDKEYLKSAIELQAISYIEKPVNTSELKATVQAAVKACLSEIEKQKLLDEASAQIEASLPIIRQDIALKLTEKKNDSEYLSALLSLAKLDLPINGNYLTILYKLNNDGELLQEKQAIYLSNILKCIDRVFREYHIRHISGIKDGTYIITHILQNPNINSQTLKIAVNLVLKHFREVLQSSNDTKYILLAGIGSYVSGMLNLYMSYQTAFLALQKVFFLGNSYIAVYEDTHETPYVFDASMNDIYEGYLNACDSDGIISYINKICEDIRRQDCTLIDNVKNLFYRLLIKLHETAVKKDIKLNSDEYNADFLWLTVSNSISLNVLKEYLLRCIKQYFHLIEEKSGKNRIAYEILVFIQKNYYDSTLSINMMAEHLVLSPAYLCQVFKKELNSTINDYINQFRIDKAKELLRDRNIKHYEVALRCGYNDSKYFSKIFKKLTAQTPSKFKENIIR